MDSVMTFALFDAARLKESCEGWMFGKDDVRFDAGAVGAVIELYPEGAELEFIDKEGRTLGFVGARFDQIERLPRRGEG